MSLLIDLEDLNALEKLGLALCKIPSVVIALSESMMTIPESRAVIIEHVINSCEFKTNVENVLLTSELKPIKRIAELETVTGLNDFTDFEDEEREPNIPEKMEALKEEIHNIEYKAPVSSTTTLEPTSKTNVRASLLVSEIRDSGKDHFTGHEIIHFLKSKLPDNCKVNDTIQNIRKVKQDVLKAASNMYPDVFLSKKKTGHKEVRLILSS